MSDDRTTVGSRICRQFVVRGTVQGVGFRPFVYRLATELALAGSVHNAGDGVTIVVEGETGSIEQFLPRLKRELPPLAQITSLTTAELPPTGRTSFTIIPSDHSHSADTFIPPDIATCDDCLSELFARDNRRHRYPFINCTNCGPRYTIVNRIPYDRPFTSMCRFSLCPECEREYHNPADRRFHAQPNACPTCGPHLTLHRSDGTAVESDDPIRETVAHLKAGRIVAIKGVGGFHLAVDPFNDTAVAELRRRKGRAQKPFALMAESIEAVRRYCDISPAEVELLSDMRRPIVLLRALSGTSITPSVAPAQKFLGFMLAYSPLHHLLLRGSFDALVMTSANFAEEPIVIDNDEAFARLSSLADYILVHDRDIVQRCDDSVVRMIDGFPQIVRRSRGFVPRPVMLRIPLKHRVLAVGGELKSVVGLGRGDAVVLSQHIGDLDNPSALKFFVQSVSHLQSVMQVQPDLIACDLHPEYLSTKWARGQSELPVVGIQHHHAHLASVLGDNGVTGRAIGIILDGTGYGSDGTIWGGEVLIGDAATFDRFAWLEPVPMPGGTAAIRSPWRMAVSYLHHAFGEEYDAVATRLLPGVSIEQRRMLVDMISHNINSPRTSSCGRLFDGVSAMLGLRTEITYDAQAAIELEMAATESGDTDTEQVDAARGALDIRPIIRSVATRRMNGDSSGDIARWFHAAVADLFVSAAIAARTHSGVAVVALGGGVLHNAILTRLICRRLHRERFEVLLARQVPPNDGGLALGQAVIADAQWKG